MPWGSNEKKKNPRFYSGLNVLTEAIKSVYGNFMKIINEEIVHDDQNKITYNIPKVIVIGAESAGKSSLLENITKCPIFPRNSTICTKQPIHLKLFCIKEDETPKYQIQIKDKVLKTDKKNIVNDIENIMNENKEEISEDVITVYIEDVNLPHFEFIDLPGIRAYPENIAIKTSNLAEKYIMMENTIILCVAPSTIPRLTSYIPISMIKKHNKCSSSMLALTMCDRVQENDIYDLLVKRLTKESDELTGLNFADCIGVINRSNHSMTLLENEKREKGWFKKNIIEQIPEDFTKEDELIKSIGSNNLINNIMNFYNTYIKETWVPKTIEKYKEQITLLRNEVKDIGPEKCPLDFSSYIELIRSELLEKTNDLIRNNRFLSFKSCFSDNKIDFINCDESVQNFLTEHYKQIKEEYLKIFKEILLNKKTEHNFNRFIPSFLEIIDNNEYFKTIDLELLFNKSNDTLKHFFLCNECVMIPGHDYRHIGDVGLRTYINNVIFMIHINIFNFWLDKVKIFNYDYNNIKENVESSKLRYELINKCNLLENNLEKMIKLKD